MTTICLFLFSFISFSIAACPSGTFNGTSDQFCYKTIIDRATWLYAEYQCTLLGGHLASIDNGFLNHILHSVANSSFGQFLSNDFWIGSSAMYLDGKYLWSDGSNLTYTNWDQGNLYFLHAIFESHEIQPGSQPKPSTLTVTTIDVARIS